MRYINNKIINDANGIRRFSSNITPKYPTDMYIRIDNMTRLDTLSYEFYNDALYWWVIADANGLGKGSLVVPAGTILQIPKL